MRSEFFNNPKNVLKIIVLFAFALWQTLPTILGLIFYWVIIQILKIKWYEVLAVGVFIAIVGAVALQQTYHLSSLHNAFILGFYGNGKFWTALLFKGFYAFSYTFSEGSIYMWSMPTLIAGILGAIDLIPVTPYEKEVAALRNANKALDKKGDGKKINKLLAGIKDENYDGTVLGISKSSGAVVVIPDRYVNQIVLTLGTTGAGKTVTLRRFYQRAVLKNYPLIIVDGKPSDESVAWIEEVARRHNKKFYGFNCSNCYHYNPLAEGGYTELKDKIISLKDEWASDYYRSIAEDYLQTTLEILQRSPVQISLEAVVEYLDYGKLGLLIRGIEDKKLKERFARLGSYETKDITGLQAHLSILVNSEFGQYFDIQEQNKTFSLQQAVRENAVVYFALPALRYPSFAKVLGKLVINDIKTVIDRKLNDHPIFTVFDEFSVFAGMQVLNLVNMGRGKGVYVVLGTQGLSDLKQVDPTFESQVLNCVNTIICHRLNDQEAAEKVALWVGTKDAIAVTTQVDFNSGANTGLGSIRRSKEFIIHPDEIKQSLEVGEAFYITKVNGFKQDKVTVKNL